LAPRITDSERRFNVEHQHDHAALHSRHSELFPHDELDGALRLELVEAWYLHSKAQRVY
jgi:hypothetical protein